MKKKIKSILQTFYMSNISSPSKDLQTFLILLQNESFPINSTKLEGGLQSILRLFGQFFSYKYQFF